MNQTYICDVLVVGGGTGGTAAAICAARRGVKTILVSEFPMLGGMLTSAGVSAPDGNELEVFQTGLWGAFLQELQHRQPGGLDNCWVSFFSYDPRIGAKIFADWVRELPNLLWITGQVPLEVYRQGGSITGVRFVLKDGAFHAVDSSELAFRLAAIGAFREAFKQAAGIMLEPVMTVEVVAPSEFQSTCPLPFILLFRI